MKNKKGLFFIVLSVAILIYFFSYFILKLFFYNINGEFLYFFKKSLTQKVNPNIIVVEIDDLTYNKLWFPLDRKDYWPFLDNLRLSNPAVVWFDILFLDKWKNKFYDDQLEKKFKEAWNIVIWFDVKNWVEAIMPHEPFKNAVKDVWYFQPTINRDTSKVYSLKPFNNLKYLDDFKYLESFSFAVLREYYNYIYSKNDKEINWAKWELIYKFFNKNIPLKWGEFYISYNKTIDFQRESFYNIYNWKFDKQKFKDKIVLVWYTAQWVKDDFLLPWIWAWATTKWVYVHANAINNVLNDTYIIYFDEIIEHLISFLFIFFIVYLNVFHLKHLNLRWISLWAVFLFLTIISIYVIFFYFSYKNSWVYLLPNYPFEFISILFLSFFISSILKYVNEDKNKKLLSKALSEYVSSDIAREILNSTWDVNLSGENKKITMFFSDIAGFTTISEKLSPEELVWFLRVYLWEMSHIIMDNKWFINKYEWDAIMALWWVFWKVENYWIVDACRSALFQQAKLKELNEVWKQQWKDELSVRMWLHTGPAIIWNIGAEGRKMEFTALWDSVNLASRLEWVNKFYWTYICVSEDIYQEVKDKFTFRYLDKIRVKWKNIWINIYELISYTWETWIFKENIIADFERGISFYQKKSFQEAFEIFSKLAQLWDAPSKTYKKRCEMYLVNPPSEDWDGIWVLDEK